MPAFAEEIEAARPGGRHARDAWSSPVRILTKDGRLTGIECVRNALGEPRRQRPARAPSRSPGSEFTCPARHADRGHRRGLRHRLHRGRRCEPHRGHQATARCRSIPDTLATNRPGVFAGGDVVTGPNTVVDAIAAGKKAAAMIDRFLRGEPLRAAARRRRCPTGLRRAAESARSDGTPGGRVATPPPADPERGGAASPRWRWRCRPTEAAREARRCLRCDLEFTEPRRRATTPEPRDGRCAHDQPDHQRPAGLGREGDDAARGGAVPGLPDPDPLPHGGAIAVRRLPPVRGGDRRGAAGASWSPPAPTRPRKG